MNNAINEIKNTLEATNSRIMEPEDRISELEDRMVAFNIVLEVSKIVLISFNSFFFFPL